MTGDTPPPPPPPLVTTFGVEGFRETLGLFGSAGLGLSGRCGLLAILEGGGGPFPRLPCRGREEEEEEGGGGWTFSLDGGTGGEGSLRGPEPGDDRECPPPRSDPRWGIGGPSRSLGEEGRLGGIGGESLLMGDGVKGDVTLLGRGGAMSRSPRLPVRVIGAGRRS